MKLPFQLSLSTRFVSFALGLPLLLASAQAQPSPASGSAPTAPWATGLCLGNGGDWHQRLRIVVSNETDRPLVGEPVEIKIGSGNGQADLVGANADALRLVNDAGIELLWTLTGPTGQPVLRGPIPVGAALALPAECPAHGQTGYSVYFDNPSAWGVPDFLEVPSGLRNGGLEEGTGNTPSGWQPDAPDAQHRTAWVTEQPHSGLKCLKTTVSEGAEETWISTRQSHLRIVGGARYVMKGWVKAAGVKGWAGWYLHVGNAQNPMILNPMLNAGADTYDWKEMTAEFSAPPNADIADLGTVLRGAGTAWFDDISLECLDAARPGVSVRASKPERLILREVGADAAWPAESEAGGWDYRFPIQVLNATAQTTGNGLISVDLAGPLARLNTRVDADHVRVMDGPKTVESFRLGSLVLFQGQADPMTRRTFHVYFRRGTAESQARVPEAIAYAPNPALPGGGSQTAEIAMAQPDYARLLSNSCNLVKNPSFEAGQELPEQWFGGEAARKQGGPQMGLVDEGLFGKRCARMTFPTNAQPEWVGWRQDVRVQPGRTYLLAGWLKCRDLSGGLQLHVHFRNARGELCQNQQMAGAGPALNGTTDWTLLHGLFTMPPDIATFQLHLTMLASGTAWHDGVVLTEVVSARLGSLQSRMATISTKPMVWPVNAVVKVFQDDLPPSSLPSARITAAGNDQEPLQLALRSPRALAQVKVIVQAPTSAGGARLTNFSIGVVGYVPVDHPSSYYSSTSPVWQRKVPADPGRSDGWAGWWPDPILPRDTFDLPANVTQPVWVTVNVPKGATPGDYAGRVRFQMADASVAELPFTIHVWDFTLPEEMHVKAIFDCRQNPAQWAVAGKSAEKTRREFWRFMAERRVCPDTIKPEPKLRYEQGRVVADFTAFDEAADYYFNTLKLPHAYTPWAFYGFGWGFPPDDRFGEKPYEGTSPFAGVDRAKLRPQFKQAYQACLKEFWSHLKAKGWDKRCVLYISDEPFDSEKPVREQMKALCAMIHEVDPAIPIYSSTWHHQPEWDGSITVWGFGHYGIVPVDKLNQIRQAGATLWWTTDGQMCLDTPFCAVERLLPHYCFKYGAEAYEFWGLDWLTYDPYAYGWHRYIHQSDQPGKSYYVRYPNGDGYLAYPGAPIGHDGPVTSVRLEQAREGCEDYEYLYLLRERIASAKRAVRDTAAAERSLAQAQGLVTIPNAGGLQSTRILPRPDAVFEIKESVARAIESLR